jgi:tRNA (Thr-GGU) A37 N-methylase
MLPIGRVACPRTEAIDDDWGEIVSRVILDDERFTAESLQGLGEFSHVDVVYVFDQVDPDAYEVGARRPRGNPSGRRSGSSPSATSAGRTGSAYARASSSRSTAPS